MAERKKPYAIYKGKKVAIGCGVCARGDEKISSSRHACAQCLSGKSQFKLITGAKTVDPNGGEENGSES